MPLHQTLEQDILALILENLDPTGHWADLGDGISPSSAPGALYMALHTSAPSGLSDTQATGEVSYTGYARLSMDRLDARWTVAAGSAGASALFLLGSVWGECMAGSPQTAAFWSIGQAGSGAGRVCWWGPIANRVVPFVARASSDLCIVTDSGVWVDGTPVAFYALPPYGVLPGGISEGTLYYAVNATAQTFQVSTTLGGSALNITSDGDGMVCWCTPIPIDVGVTPRLPASTLYLRLR